MLGELEVFHFLGIGMDGEMFLPRESSHVPPLGLSRSYLISTLEQILEIPNTGHIFLPCGYGPTP